MLGGKYGGDNMPFVSKEFYYDTRAKAILIASRSPRIGERFASSCSMNGHDGAERSRKLNFATEPSPSYSVRPDGAYHQWGKDPPRELSIDLVADERLGRVTGQVEAS